MLEQTHYGIVDHMIINGILGDDKKETLKSSINRRIIQMFINENSWIVKRTNKRETVFSRRYLAVYMVRELGMTFESTGRMLGGYNHSTISHHIQKHDDFMQFKDKTYMGIVNDMDQLITEFKLSHNAN